MPYQEKQSRGAFLRKLSFYLSGIAIGFIMLGIFSQLKKAHTQRTQAAQAAAAAEAAKRPALFPPAPSEEGQLPQTADSANTPPSEPAASPN